MNKTALTAAAAAVFALVVMATVVGSAGATYRGETDGRLAFGININGNTDVYSVRPDGQDLQRLTTDPGFDACAAYSADGKKIAYCSGQGGGPVQVWTMNQDGTDKQQVTHMSVLAIFPDFSPDGSKIVFCAGPSTFARDIYVAGSDGSDLTRLTSGAGNNVYPAFSPNGRKIVFTSNRSGTSQVWLMNADGSDQRQLTFDPQPKDQVPDWSPNGSKIAYLADTHGVADMGNSWGDIWVMNANGSHQHQITGGATYYGAAWSPDGDRIATLDIPTRTVYTINAGDGSDAQAVHPSGLQFVPGWQPVGRQGRQPGQRPRRPVKAAPHSPPSEEEKDMNGKVLTLVRTTIVPVSVVAVAAPVIPAQAAHRPASTHPTHRAALVTTTIKVTTFNSSFHLSAKTAPRGVVIFKVTNAASFGHDFSINGHTTRVLRKGESATLRVTFLKPGHYVYRDTVDHHVQWGDVGGFTIT